jgi:hypothetical protein
MKIAVCAPWLKDQGDSQNIMSFIQVYDALSEEEAIGMYIKSSYEDKRLQGRTLIHSPVSIVIDQQRIVEDAQKIPYEGPRIETGPVQIGKDWPGVFIRGDVALYNGILIESISKLLLSCEQKPLEEQRHEE